LCEIIEKIDCRRQKNWKVIFKISLLYFLQEKVKKTSGSRGAKGPWCPPDFAGIEKRTEKEIDSPPSAASEL
jgi:hypothetical protein